MIKIDFYPTNKFKTTLLCIRLIAPFSVETINDRALIPQILASGTKKYRSKAGLSRRLDFLYGTSFSVFTAKIGFQSVIHFQIQFPSEVFLPEQESISFEVIDLLKEIIFNPMIKNGHFAKTVVDEEVRLLIENFESEYNDKNEFAFQQFKKAMFQGELYSHRSKGDLATLNQVSPQSLWNSYQSMIHEDEIHVSVVGMFDQKAIESHLSLAFPFGNQLQVEQWIDTQTKTIASPIRITEQNSVKQAKIFLGFRTHYRYDDIEHPSMVVFNTLFGESDQSKLFRIIREEQHLCYYVSSSYDSNKGFLFVSMGVEPGKELQAIDHVTDVLKRIQNGEISEDELNFAKVSQNRRIRQKDDSIVSLSASDFYYRQVHHLPYDTLTILEQLEAVSKEKVVQAAKSLVLDTLYTLTKKDLL